MTNQEFATELRAIADFYEKEAPEGLHQPTIFIYLWDKKDLLAVASAVKPFVKEYSEHEGHIKPKRFPSLKITFSRNLVCKKVVTWDCESLLSPEENAQLEEIGQ